MIKQNNKDIIAIQWQSKPIVAIYHGVNLIWQLANSCFGSGIWINTKQWSNTDSWRNI